MVEAREAPDLADPGQTNAEPWQGGLRTESAGSEGLDLALREPGWMPQEGAGHTGPSPVGGGWWAGFGAGREDGAGWGVFGARWVFLP
jgi:hypothetical protein